MDNLELNIYDIDLLTGMLIIKIDKLKSSLYGVTEKNQQTIDSYKKIILKLRDLREKTQSAK